MPEPVLPVEAVRSDARHKDVGAQVFAVVPQRPAPFAKRLFWRFVLFVAQFPIGLRLLKRLRGS